MNKTKLFLIFGFTIGYFNLSSLQAATPETVNDAPWAEASRKIQGKPKAQIEKTLSSQIPSVLLELKQVKKLIAFHGLWGKSKNYDEFAKSKIVDDSILNALADLSGLPRCKKEICHAGLIHTYGYLLSLLDTPYGYKRSRWVSGELDDGFGVEKGVLGATPKVGSLFADITYFTGQIAFRGEMPQLKILSQNLGALHPTLRQFPFDHLNAKRLTETFEKPRRVSLRTDIVEFPNFSKTPDQNTSLLIYSVKDSKEKTSKLITAFPVKAAFVKNLFQDLGEAKAISLKYNLSLEGIGGTPLTGKKEVDEVKSK